MNNSKRNDLEEDQPVVRREREGERERERGSSRSVAAE